MLRSLAFLLAVHAVIAAPAPQTNKVDAASGFVLPTALPENPAELAYRDLLARDDAAQEEIDRWIEQADAAGSKADVDALQRRIKDRIDGVNGAYRQFLGKYPDHARARIAFGSFLNDTGQETAAREEWEKARELDPENPAIYNNLAGIYGHHGPVTNAFAYYEKAIKLAPSESLYHWNLATTVFLYRLDVMEYYGLTNEQQVFDKSLALYRKALELDPKNFVLATDLAQSYYLLKPARDDEALAAWQKAYDLASDSLERESTRVHLARIQIQAGRFEEARAQLEQVTNTNLAPLKARVLQTLERRKNAAATNAPPADAKTQP